MKEFNSQDGGRYTFVDDVQNLQALALAFNSIFRDCDNFVIWGCELSGDTVSEGYVYLNGKVRYFAGGMATADLKGRRYLFEHNTTETVPYASGDSKIGRTNYGVSLMNDVPVAPDEVTGLMPQYITINSNGTRKNIKDAFFGRYAVILNPNNLQIIDGNIEIDGMLTVDDELCTGASVRVMSPLGETCMEYSGNQFYLDSTVSGTRYMISFSDGTITFSIGGVKVLSIKDSSVTFHKPVTLDTITAGDIKVISNQIYNPTSANGAVVNINMVGDSGSVKDAKITNIGNGKGVAMLCVDGVSDSVIFNAASIVLNRASVVLKDTQSTSGSTKSFKWQDSKNADVCILGYSGDDIKTFAIKNTVGNIVLIGLESVDLGPVIKEGGKPLSEKYVLRENLTTALSTKADANKVYSKTEADGRFAALTGGFSQFTKSTTPELLRSQIGAASTTELADYAKKSELLSDMAKTAGDKAAIRRNIGAIGADECQLKLKDTGWKAVGSTGLYARQIGDIVSIQGVLLTMHSGVVFTLPSEIEAPTYNVGYSWGTSGNDEWNCQIQPKSRTAEVVHCNACGRYIPFTMTYFV